MRTSLPLLCLLWVACAGAPSRSEYRQSAAPMAPTFNPTWEAPHTVGQPGYIGAPEHVPRTASKRYLPETEQTRREPGLWAAEAPRAISDEDRAVVNPYLASLSIVLPDDDALMGDTTDSTPAKWCRAFIFTHIRNSAAILRSTPLAKESERRCLGAMLLEGCLRRVTSEHEAFGGAFSTTSPYALAVLETRRARYCPDVTARGVKPTYLVFEPALDLIAKGTR